MTSDTFIVFEQDYAIMKTCEIFLLSQQFVTLLKLSLNLEQILKS